MLKNPAACFVGVVVFRGSCPSLSIAIYSGPSPLVPASGLCPHSELLFSPCIAQKCGPVEIRPLVSWASLSSVVVVPHYQSQSTVVQVHWCRLLDFACIANFCSLPASHKNVVQLKSASRRGRIISTVTNSTRRRKKGRCRAQLIHYQERKDSSRLASVPCAPSVCLPIWPNVVMALLPSLTFASVPTINIS